MSICLHYAILLCRFIITHSTMVLQFYFLVWWEYFTFTRAQCTVRKAAKTCPLFIIPTNYSGSLSRYWKYSTTAYFGYHDVNNLSLSQPSYLLYSTSQFDECYWTYNEYKPRKKGLESWARSGGLSFPATQANFPINDRNFFWAKSGTQYSVTGTLEFITANYQQKSSVIAKGEF